MSRKTTKEVDVETNEGTWQLGVVPHETYGFLWGLSSYGYLTHMCYGGDYAVPTECLEKVREFGQFYFDAGGNGRPLYVEVDELERAFRELELL